MTARLNSKGGVEAIFCNGCNSVITYTEGGRPVRATNYVEAKISFRDDDGFHIMCGCQDCIAKALNNPQILETWYLMDVNEAPDGYSDRQKVRKPDKIVQTGIGIL